MKKIYTLLVGFTAFALVASAQCEDGRYIDQIFNDVSVATDVVYGSNVTSDGNTVDLLMDIYTPTGDAETNRPVIVFAHGGSFVSGSKANEDVALLANRFAQRGYVTASINYRLEPQANLFAQTDSFMVKAVIRAFQDGKAAIRFFRKSADEGNPYGINPNEIYAGGASAGAIIAGHIAYLDRVEEFNPMWQDYLVRLGGVDGESGNPGFSNDVSAVINVAGALADSSYIESGDVPLVSFHSTQDGTVPYVVGKPLGLAHLPDLMGTRTMNNRAIEVGVESVTKIYQGTNHPPYVEASGGQNNFLVEIFDEVDSIAMAFLAVQKGCDVNQSTSIDGINARYNALTVYPNPTNNTLFIADVHASNLEGAIYNMIGAEMQQFQLDASGEAKIDVTDLPKGIFWVKAGNSVAKVLK